MTILELFKILQSSSIGRYIGGLDHLFCAVMELAHIIGMILLLASIFLTGLHLFGLGLKQLTTRQMQHATSRLFWTGLVLLVVSGLFIFIPAATSYYPNAFFWLKFLLLFFALLVYLTLYRKVAGADTAIGLLAKTTGGLLVGLWFGVAFAGRFIGFLA